MVAALRCWVGMCPVLWPRQTQFMTRCCGFLKWQSGRQFRPTRQRTGWPKSVGRVNRTDAETIFQLISCAGSKKLWHLYSMLIEAHCEQSAYLAVALRMRADYWLPWRRLNQAAQGGILRHDAGERAARNHCARAHGPGLRHIADVQHRLPQ